MNSIIDYLKQQGQDSSFNSRAKLAEAQGITGYNGTAEQNTQLLNMLQGKPNTAQNSPTATSVNIPNPVFSGFQSQLGTGAFSTAQSLQPIKVNTDNILNRFTQAATRGAISLLPFGNTINTLNSIPSQLQTQPVQQFSNTGVKPQGNLTITGQAVMPNTQANEMPDNFYSNQNSEATKYSEADKIVNALALTESGGNPNAVGYDGLSKGVMQFTDATWNALTKGKIAKTPENEKKVAREEILRLLNKGYKADEIAAIWNMGEGNFTKNKGYSTATGAVADWRGVSSQSGAKYDTVKHVSRFNDFYNKGTVPEIYKNDTQSPTGTGQFQNSQNQEAVPQVAIVPLSQQLQGLNFSTYVNPANQTQSKIDTDTQFYNKYASTLEDAMRGLDENNSKYVTELAQETQRSIDAQKALNYTNESFINRYNEATGLQRYTPMQAYANITSERERYANQVSLVKERETKLVREAENKRLKDRVDIAKTLYGLEQDKVSNTIALKSKELAYQKQLQDFQDDKIKPFLQSIYSGLQGKTPEQQQQLIQGFANNLNVSPEYIKAQAINFETQRGSVVSDVIQKYLSTYPDAQIPVEAIYSNNLQAVQNAIRNTSSIYQNNQAKDIADTALVNAKVQSELGTLGGGTLSTTGTGNTSAAQAWIDQFNSGLLTAEEIYTKIGSSDKAFALKNEIAQIIASQGGKRVFKPDSTSVSKIQEQISNLDNLLKNDIYKSISGALKVPSPFGTKGDALTLVSQVLQSETLNQLADAKAKGITFGSLSNAELNAVASAAGNLRSRAITEDGQIVGFKGSEQGFLDDLNILKTNLQKSIVDKTGNTSTTSNTTTSGYSYTVK